MVNDRGRWCWKPVQETVKETFRKIWAEVKQHRDKEHVQVGVDVDCDMMRHFVQHTDSSVGPGRGLRNLSPLP